MRLRKAAQRCLQNLEHSSQLRFSNSCHSSARKCFHPSLCAERKGQHLTSGARRLGEGVLATQRSMIRPGKRRLWWRKMGAPRSLQKSKSPGQQDSTQDRNHRRQVGSPSVECAEEVGAADSVGLASGMQSCCRDHHGERCTTQELPRSFRKGA